MGILAQVLLARWLGPQDFGLFALTLSTAVLFTALGSAGIRTLMTQQTALEAHGMGPSAFRFGLKTSIAAGVAMVIGAPIFAAIFNEGALISLIVVSSITFPLKPYVAVAIPTLQAQLEFRVVAIALLVGSAAHYGTALLLASNGVGAMSLVVGMQVGVVALAASLFAMSDMRPWRPTETTLGSRDIARLTRWPLAGELATEASGRIDYFIVGLFAPTAIVGGYYFAYQLVARSGELLLGVARNVLFPALAQIKTDHRRQTRWLYEGGTTLVLAGGAGAALLIAAMPTVELLIWDGKWAYVMLAVALLATAVPMQIALAAPEQLLKARGSFKEWTTILMVRVAGVAATALVVGMATGGDLTPTIIAAAIAGYLVVEAVLEITVLSRMLSFSATRYLGNVAPLWLWLVGIGWVGHIVVDQTDAGLVPSLLLATITVALGAAAAIGVALKAGRIQLRKR